MDCHTACLHNCPSLSVSAITFVTRSKTNMAIRQRLCGARGGVDCTGVVGRVGDGHGQWRSGARAAGGGREVSMRPMTLYFALLKQVGLPAENSKFRRTSTFWPRFRWSSTLHERCNSRRRRPPIERPCRVSKPEICGSIDLSV